MKCTLEKIIDDVQFLVSRIETRERAADQMREQIVQIQSGLLSMRKYQEEVCSFNELSERLSGHPKGPLIRCLAAENKQLEQLQMENRTLYTSLDEHQVAMDLIMKKYRSQITKLIQANQVESELKSSSNSSADHTKTRKHLSNPESINGIEQGSNDQLSNTTLLSQQIYALAAIAEEVCDHGDAYTTELETEMQRLRLENAGLREMLMISTDHSIDSSDSLANLHPIPGSSPLPSAGVFDRPRVRYMAHNRPSHPLSADACTPNSQCAQSAPVTSAPMQPFDTFASYSPGEPQDYGGEQLSVNRNNETDDKDDVVTIWDNDEGEMNKTSYGNQISTLLTETDGDNSQD